MCYDIFEDNENSLERIQSLIEKNSKAKVVIFDLNVLSSTYFSGGTYPFPFSIGIEYLTKLLKMLRESELLYVGFCNFNPTVEYRTSSFLILDIVYKLLKDN